MHIFNDHMLTELKAQGINIKEIVFCPHAPEDQCDCRKPSPKLINLLYEKHNIDRANSWMVGDKSSDIEAGRNAGLKTFKVKTSSLTNFLNKINAIAS